MAVRAAPALLVLLAADGLRRGRRLAWWLAVIINLAVLGAGIRAACAAGPGGHLAGPGAGGRAILLAGEAMLLPAGTLIVLLAARRR